MYKDVKDLTTKKYVEKISNGADKILSESRINLKPVSFKKRHSEIVNKES